MYLQYSFTACNIRTVYCDLAVKTSWTQQCWVKDIRSVRCGNDDDPLVGTESIHFYKQLVKRLFTLIMSSAETSATLAADCINFIYEYDTWSILFCCFK
ncbi:hypothetical protein AYJ66_17275 [Dietzia cinnamea]|nr:hypothetical protein AYJ66_17275 [Dietzia cinnamea]